MAKRLLMAISAQKANNRIANFTRKKSHILGTTQNGEKLYSKQPEQTVIFYTLKQFTCLLQKTGIFEKTDTTGLNIYLATYKCHPNDSATNACVPTGLEDTLTIVFAPTKTGTDKNGNGTEIDKGNYYIIHPCDKSCPKEVSDNENIHPGWHCEYKKAKKQQLEDAQGIDETEYMFLGAAPLRNLIEFITEHNKKASTPITGIFIFFAAYKDAEKINTYTYDDNDNPVIFVTKKKKVDKQLTIIFNLSTQIVNLHGVNIDVPISFESLLEDKDGYEEAFAELTSGNGGTDGDTVDPHPPPPTQ